MSKTCTAVSDGKPCLIALPVCGLRTDRAAGLQTRLPDRYFSQSEVKIHPLSGPKISARQHRAIIVRRPKRTAEQLVKLIKERSAQFGAWPDKMTILAYAMNDTWEVIISPGKTTAEQEYRVSALWAAVQMQNEFDLK